MNRSVRHGRPSAGFALNPTKVIGFGLLGELVQESEFASIRVHSRFRGVRYKSQKAE